jgi:hypothetical protein
MTSGIGLDRFRWTLMPWTAVARLPAKEEQQGLRQESGQIKEV